MYICLIMKNLYTLGLFILMSLAPLRMAAQKGMIGGVISDAETGNEIPYASVAVYSSGSTSPLKGAVSDDLGAFRIGELPFETYDLVVSFIGFQADTIRNTKNKVTTIHLDTFAGPNRGTSRRCWR